MVILCETCGQRPATVYRRWSSGRIEQLCEQCDGARLVHGHGPGGRGTVHVSFLDTLTGKQCTLGPGGGGVPDRRFLSDVDVRQLFATHVPAIGAGEVEIRSMAREPGRMGLYAVWSRSSPAYAVESCCGPRAIYLRAIAEKLGREFPTILHWKEAAEEFIRAAVATAGYEPTFKPPKVALDAEIHQATVELDPNTIARMLSEGELRRRLISQLVGWKLNLVESPS